MSREFNQILTLAKDLSQEELSQLMREIEALRIPDEMNEGIEIPEEEKRIVRERFAKVDRGESVLNRWEDVKGRVFKK